MILESRKRATTLVVETLQRLGISLVIRLRDIIIRAPLGDAKTIKLLVVLKVKSRSATFTRHFVLCCVVLDWLVWWVVWSKTLVGNDRNYEF